MNLFLEESFFSSCKIILKPRSLRINIKFMREALKTVRKNLQTARFTYIIILYCGIIYIGLWLTESSSFITDRTLTKFGAPTAIEIFSGRFWGIITNSFVHFSSIHLLVNLIITLFIASYVERRIGFWKLFIVGLVSSLVSSAFQLSLSNDAGIGLSGVNYALFGFIFGKTFIDQRFRIVTKHLALIVMILFIPFFEIMNRFANWNIATISLISGLIFGVLVALLSSKWYILASIFLILMCSFSIVSLFYSPWSAEWNCSVAIKFHDNLKLNSAKIYYQRAVEINPDARCALDNLRLIKIDELSDKALKLHLNGKYEQAKLVYDQILKTDPTNQWAKQNKRLLP